MTVMHSDEQPSLSSVCPDKLAADGRTMQILHRVTVLAFVLISINTATTFLENPNGNFELLIL
jgi:hypothetical protein